MNLPAKKEPPLPDPLLHKYVEEREMNLRAWDCGFNVRMLSENLSMNFSTKKEPPLPGPLLHKCVEEREMEWRAPVKMRRVILITRLDNSFSRGVGR